MEMMMSPVGQDRASMQKPFDNENEDGSEGEDDENKITVTLANKDSKIISIDTPNNQFKNRRQDRNTTLDGSRDRDKSNKVFNNSLSNLSSKQSIGASRYGPGTK